MVAETRPTLTAIERAKLDWLRALLGDDSEVLAFLEGRAQHRGKAAPPGMVAGVKQREARDLDATIADVGRRVDEVAARLATLPDSVAAAITSSLRGDLLAAVQNLALVQPSGERARASRSPGAAYARDLIGTGQRAKAAAAAPTTATGRRASPYLADLAALAAASAPLIPGARTAGS